jgi:Fur family transcriptional regulator, peroxide stress response regulator
MRQFAKDNKNKDYRLTSQRLTILDYIRKNRSHPLAEDILNAVKKKLPTISFGTVYRNLDFLRQHGYIKEFVVNKVSRYESRVDSHVHLVCEQCGRIEDLPDKELVLEAKKLTTRQRFFARSDNLEIRGICVECQKKMPLRDRAPELFCMACGELLEDLAREAPVCKSCCFKTNCNYYGPAKT